MISRAARGSRQNNATCAATCAVTCAVAEPLQLLIFLWVVVKTFGQSADGPLLREPEQFGPHRFRTPKIHEILGWSTTPLPWPYIRLTILFAMSCMLFTSEAV